VKDQPSNSGPPYPEPKRPSSIPSCFVWYPELRYWDYPPGGYPEFDWEEYWVRVQEEIEKKYPREDREGPHLISVDDLRAAGVFDVPAWMRKSLGRQECDLFSDLVEDDENLDKSAPPPTPSSTPSPGRKRRRSPK
jgi:hypothetical protein